MEKTKSILVTFIAVLLGEFIFEILTFGALENIVLKIIFLMQISILLNIFCLFGKKVNKIIITVFLILFTLLYISQYIYYTIFESALGLYDILKSGQVAQFTTPIFTIIKDNILQILLFLLPLIAFGIINKWIEFKRNTKKQIICLCIIFICLYLISVLIINLSSNNEIFSIKNLYYNINNGTQNLKKFGVITAGRLDLQRTVFSFKEKQLYQYEDESGNVKILDSSKYNMLDIDFDELIANESDDEIKEIHKYIKSQEPTEKNDYTGKYKDKNLIVIIGESFSLQAINKDVTPTLYKIYNESIQFKNFYTPLFPVSTADGEYLTDTSLLPAEGVWSIEEVGNNIYPYTYGNILKKYGYETYAYHNYHYDYYKRDIYFETMGYDTYLSWGNGLEERMDFSQFPASDYDMIKSTVDDYINDDKFVAYYITISGHMNYDETNAMVNKNWSSVKDLPYSKKAKSYLATQIELDKAVEELINTLEEKDKMKDTVIVITGDHYPYGLTENELKELITYDIVDYDLDKFRMPFIIYTGEDQSDIVVEKNACSLDVLPTVLNLFGVDYDSRLLMGKDIFSNSEPLIIFSNRSFITQNERYNSNNGTLYRDGLLVQDEEYIRKMKQQIYYKYRYSRLILEKNYYSKITY